MIKRIGQRLGPFVVAIALLAGNAAAQTIRLPLDRPTHELRVGQKINLVEDDGEPKKARIIEIAGDRVVVTITDRRRRTSQSGAAVVEVPAERVTRVQRGDSLRNGALTGFLIGAGFALNRLGDCEINCYGAFVPVLGGLGAAIGTLVDVFKRSTTLTVTSEGVPES